MGSPQVALLARWNDISSELGWPQEEAGSLGDDLVARYQEPHRHYHGIDHLHSVLTVLDDLAAPQPAPVTVRLAAWFHDAVYTGSAGTDEEASAQLAESKLTSVGLPANDAAAVANMVRATADHFTPGIRHDPLTSLLLDADLAILGADPAAYSRYCDGVRAEYAHVPDERFRLGRLAVVEALLQRERLYLTDRAAASFEHPARRNLQSERDRLQRTSVDERS